MSVVATTPPKAKDAIDVIRPQVTAVLPQHVNAERFIRSVNLAVAQNPYLLKLDRMSLLQSVMKAAELGLTPNSALGECYLIPFKDKVQMIPGYRGMITLARRSGEITKIGAHVVYDGEVFEVSFGPDGTFKHVPNLEAEGAKKRFAYAYAVFKDGTSHVEVVPRAKIEKTKADSLSKIKDEWRRSESPWTKHEDEMWRKTAIRALFKYLPVSTEDIRRALDADNDAAKDRGEAADFSEFSVEAEVVEDRATPARPDATAKLTAALANDAPSPEEQAEIRAQLEAEARDAR